MKVLHKAVFGDPYLGGGLHDIMDGAVRRLVCKIFGHDMISGDWATPDSGYMGAHCERCGFGGGSYLY